MATKKPEPEAKPAPKRKPAAEVPEPITASLTDAIWCMGEGAELKLQVLAGRNTLRADVSRCGHSHSSDFPTAGLSDADLMAFLRAADDTLPR